MNFQRRLRRLNNQFEKFGRNPHGDLNIKWSHTSELVYYIEKGRGSMDKADWKRSGSLFVADFKYERHSWAETGHGPVWILSIWQPPIPLDQWLAQVGHAFPYPARGEYAPFENIALDPGQEPNGFWTQQAVIRLDYELGNTPRETVEAMLNDYRKQWQSTMNEIKDDIDDTLTAFGKIPGSKDSGVSLPTPKRLIAAQGGTPIEPISGDNSGH